MPSAKGESIPLSPTVVGGDPSPSGSLSPYIEQIIEGKMLKMDSR